MNLSGVVLYSDATKVSHNTMLWGKKMWQWVAQSLDEHTLLKYDSDFLPIVQQHLRSCAELPEFFVVLFADTPLIQKSTVDEAVCHIKDSGKNAVRLLRGFVFESNYLLEIDELPALDTFYCGDDDFVYAADNVKLAVVSESLRRRINEFHLSCGVRIIDPATTYIDCNVKIAEGTIIYPNNVVRGDTVLVGCELDVGNVIEDSVVLGGSRVRSSTLEGARVLENCTVGPNAYLRKGAVVENGCRIGDFVEIKNARVGEGTKISHLSYVGDADIGTGCNIGCGVVFVNYNGKSKSRTVVGNRVFVGSNCNLVAPLVLEDGAYIAAGSTITDSVPKDSLAIARERQVVKEGWNKGKF